MSFDVEETLSRELREVADGLQIPAIPPLPAQPPRAPRHWQPVLAAAAAVLIVAGIAVAATTWGGQEPGPASPLPSRTESVGEIPTTAPTVPYVLDNQLYVDGQLVPGAFWAVWGVDRGWLAVSPDNTWWWGQGSLPNQIPGRHSTPPVISPNGKFVAEIRVDNGQGMLTAFDTSSGRLLGSVPVDLGSRQKGTAVTIRAVTDDGKVIAQGANTGLMWLPLAGNATVDLTVSAGGEEILDGTSAGLIVTDLTDGATGQRYLAVISDAGVLTRTGLLPLYDSIAVSSGGVWLAWTPLGTLGGEVTETSTLEAETLDGTQRVTLTAPDGWSFSVQSWVWEDDSYLVARVDGGGAQRMARCSGQLATCVLIDTP